MSLNDWQLINRRLVAKGLSELLYEEIIAVEDKGAGLYRLETDKNASYEFKAWRTVWGMYRIDADSLVRKVGTKTSTDLNASQFYIDIQTQLGIGDITMSHFLEELYRTLHADQKTLERQRAFANRDWSALPDHEIQSLMDGHPKALLAKGRGSWSIDDTAAYSPEESTSLRLHWVAAARSSISLGIAEGQSLSDVYASTFDEAEWARIQSALTAQGLSLETHALIPVHPWQWRETIALHYQQDIAEGRLVHLGVFGAHYWPQISLRTLTNGENARKLQLKLAVSILNTSCVRGISGQYLAISPALSEAVQTLCWDDERLKDVVVLRESAGVHFAHTAYEALPESPYRYKEFLGCIWRESPESRLPAGEHAILSAALFQKDAEGQSLLARYIAKSGLSHRAWLQAYARKVLVPLYHLQVRYGIGLVAHGQNVMLALKDSIPERLIIKDFQGDLRIVASNYPELDKLPASIRAELTKLPPHYLIHDLITGHLVTVLRFISASLKESDGYEETNFYRDLAEVLQDYEASVPEYADRVKATSLLAPEFARVLVNKVRFKQGYADTSERPVPLVGSQLINPLHRALSQGEKSGTLS